MFSKLYHSTQNKWLEWVLVTMGGVCSLIYWAADSPDRVSCFDCCVLQNSKKKKEEKHRNNVLHLPDSWDVWGAEGAVLCNIWLHRYASGHGIHQIQDALVLPIQSPDTCWSWRETDDPELPLGLSHQGRNSIRSAEVGFPFLKSAFQRQTEQGTTSYQEMLMSPHVSRGNTFMSGQKIQTPESQIAFSLCSLALTCLYFSFLNLWVYILSCT